MTAGTPSASIPSYNFAKAGGLLLTGVGQEFAQVTVCDGKVTLLALAETRRACGRPLRITRVGVKEFDRLLESEYSSEGAVHDVADSLEKDTSLTNLAEELPKVTDLLESGDEAPVIRFINVLMTQALRDKASDIHFELFENRSVTRFRIDGVLRDIIEPPSALHAALASRIKVMANLDIAEKRLPQDGRFALKLAGRPVDVRISVLPTAHGERVVLRLLDKMEGVLGLEKLGMNRQLLVPVDSLINRSHGILLVTGPTGSGKTTTLYAALSRLNVKKTNIMTVEDPIEYNLDGISQTQVSAKIGMTFAGALRSILRQDPDVIMIGEIRDLETAQIAVQASLTGHLVIATLHTNDSIGALTRLADMGIEPFLLSSSVLGVLAQRLVRILCPKCKKTRNPDEAERKTLPEGTSSISEPVGCDECNGTGYQGRSGLFELCVMDDELRHMVHEGSAEHKMRNYLVETQGMKNLRGDGMRLVSKGVTSIEEVLRVTEV